MLSGWCMEIKSIKKVILDDITIILIRKTLAGLNCKLHIIYHH